MSRTRLIDLLRNEILNLDLAELDFGVYRVLNYRRAEVEQFFDTTLPSRVDSALDQGGGVTDDQLCNALYTFFRRYYRDGDFIPQSRRGQNAKYSVPYNGEDVLLYWRGRGTHYVKTTEELKRYRFKCAGWTVTCQLVDAEAHEVPGKTRFFVPVAVDSLVDSRELVISFVFRTLTADETTAHKAAADESDTSRPIQAALLETIRANSALPAALASEAFQTNLLRYARKNREDYFVHPDLRRFLRGELDYYVRTEVLDLAAGNHLLGELVLRLALEIVEFLSDVEDLQARLFEKPKFVLGASYWTPIRLVPHELRPRILESDRQLAEWRELFGATAAIDLAFLETHPSLVVDTALHSADLKWHLLATFEDIDDSTDGLLVKSENYAALRTILPGFRGRVRLSYNDPPYNTGKDEFLYKDDFSRSSTWLAMMDERVRLVHEMLDEDGVFVCSIADHEQARLKLLCDDIFTATNFVSAMIWVNEGNIDNQSQIKGNHEYLLLYSKNRDLFEAPRVKDPNLAANSKLANDTIENTITKNGPKNPPSDVLLPIGFPASFEEGVVEPGTTNWPKLSRPIVVKDWRLQEAVIATSGWSSRKLLDRFIQSDFAPVKDLNGVDTRFAVTTTGAIYLYKPRSPDQSHVLSVITGGVGSVQQMSSYLSNMGFNFSYPKPLALIEYVLRWHNAASGWFADFFAGSGTTGEAVIRFNREGLGDRRFLLVEMAHYFDEILAPRIKRVMYSPTWTKGAAAPEPTFGPDQQPQWLTRSPRLVKVLRLESYEDSLDSLEASEEDGKASLFHEGNVLKYVTSSASRSAPLLSTETLESPDSYRLRVHTPMGLEDMAVDLPETFCLVAGAHVRRVATASDDGREYILMMGEFDGRDALVVWRNIDELDPAHERVFLESTTSTKFGRGLSSFDIVFHNADAALPNGESLDLRLMAAMRGAHEDG